MPSRIHVWVKEHLACLGTDCTAVISFFSAACHQRSGTSIFCWVRQGTVFRSVILCTTKAQHQLGFSKPESKLHTLKACIPWNVYQRQLPSNPRWDPIQTVEPILKDRAIGHRVAQDRWSLVTGSFTLKYRTFCPKMVVLPDRWSLVAVASQEMFHCIGLLKHTEYLPDAHSGCSRHYVHTDSRVTARGRNPTAVVRPKGILTPG